MGVIYNRHIGSCLKQARKNTGLSLNDIACHMNIPKYDLTRYEDGKEPIPQEVLIKLLQAGIHFYPTV